MVKPAWFMTLLLVVTLALGGLVPSGLAQVEKQRGKVMYGWFREIILRDATTLSNGELAQLQTDSNFVGDYAVIVAAASGILEDYVVVERGGYFPENQGIPRNQQLTRTEAVYRVFVLENGRELVLFRTPAKNTAEYVIRRAKGN